MVDVTCSVLRVTVVNLGGRGAMEVICVGPHQVLTEAELLASSDGQLKKLLEEREDGTHYIDAQYVPLHHPRFLPMLVGAALADGMREDLFRSEGVSADCIELHMQLAFFAKKSPTNIAHKQRWRYCGSTHSAAPRRTSRLALGGMLYSRSNSPEASALSLIGTSVRSG